MQCDCLIYFDYLEIIHFDSNKIRLFIKGSLFIKRDKPALERTIKLSFLKLFY